MWCRWAAAAPIQTPSLGTCICLKCSPKKQKKNKKKQQQKKQLKLWEVNGEKSIKPKAGSLRILIKLRYIYKAEEKILISRMKTEKMKP